MLSLKSSEREVRDEVKSLISCQFYLIRLIIEENGRTTSNVFGHGQAFSIKNFRPEYRSQDVGIGPETIPLSDALSWNYINARVLAQSNGTFSLCMQLLKSKYKAREVLRYSVVEFHHLMTQVSSLEKHLV